jgi:hypothetical protein
MRSVRALTQPVEHRRDELGRLVEVEDAMVGEGYV